MFESCKVLSLNSHETVLEISSPDSDPGKALKKIQTHL